MDDDRFYRTSIKALITDDLGKILLLSGKVDEGKWELPGSGLVHGEDPIESLKYHIAKETGRQVISVSESPKYFITVASDRSPGKWLSNIIYEVHLDNFDFKSPDYALHFFSLEEAKSQPLLSNVQKFLEVLSS